MSYNPTKKKTDSTYLKKKEAVEDGFKLRHSATRGKL